MPRRQWWRCNSGDGVDGERLQRGGLGAAQLGEETTVNLVDNSRVPRVNGGSGSTRKSDDRAMVSAKKGYDATSGKTDEGMG